MTVVTVIPAKPEHAAQLAPLMRAADLAECIAAGYADARSALDEALANSVEAWAMLFDGEVAALVGVDPLEGSGSTLVWALTGQAVDRAKLSYLRAGRLILRDLLRRWPILVNLVDSRYQGALDWLECLGFTIGPEVPHPITGLSFRRVSIIGGV